MRRYPRQFWYLIFGMLVSTTGMGMIWPFLTIYLRQTLNLPLATITSLLMLDSIMSVIATVIAGPVADRFGRKWVMVISLAMVGVIYLVMSSATSLSLFAVLMALRGAFMPLYRIGADSMVADMIPNEQRVDAYSISRTVNNIGIALGPTAGGFVTGSSYTLAFFIAAICLAAFAIFITFLMRETLPDEVRAHPAPLRANVYNDVIKDRYFVSFVASFTLVSMGASSVFTLLTAYMKDNFGILERYSGFVMAVNALMVIFFQYAVTRVTRRHPPVAVMIVGGLLYAAGIGGMAFGRTFPHFAVSMAVMTLGELVLMPTSTTYAANLAPAAQRARYMSFYNLGWGISHGFGPVVAGVLNDSISPAAMWWGGMAWSLLGALMFVVLRRRQKRAVASPTA
ncbi:MAG TPA: MFS transporter [Anaerolineaceae bacterium]